LDLERDFYSANPKQENRLDMELMTTPGQGKQQCG
jgi:hypothetical protein